METILLKGEVVGITASLSRCGCQILASASLALLQSRAIVVHVSRCGLFVEAYRGRRGRLLNRS